ncbi:phosphoribosyl transferase [Candidatus Kaiserbacteria bacterium]|nr:phosphoribosyl transferase [Candidatus Kaiserbacteria bacterium]
MFDDRRDAGKKLSAQLERFAGGDAVVFALPRGGVAVGAEIARSLKLPLDIIVVRKIGHPTSPEYAIGVVNGKGETIMNEAEAASVDVTWLAEETERQRKEAARRLVAYRGKREPLVLTGKTAILVDDGVATGFTMRLAVRRAKALGAVKIIVALPVAPEGTEAMLKHEGADEVVILEPPEEFMGAVGAHYIDFPQLSDAAVTALLEGVRHVTPHGSIR